MMESDTYLYLLEQGEAEASRKILLRVGRKRFGEADENVRAALKASDDLERLERMSERLLDVASWQELLQTL